MSERIRDLAKVIVAQHGAEAALAMARDRVRMWRGVGDDAWAVVWIQVAVEVREMLSPVKAHARSSARPTLPELLDDPVMTAVLRDDDERRRAVVETLSSTKRRLSG